MTLNFALIAFEQNPTDATARQLRAMATKKAMERQLSSIEWLGYMRLTRDFNTEGYVQDAG